MKKVAVDGEGMEVFEKKCSVSSWPKKTVHWEEREDEEEDEKDQGEEEGVVEEEEEEEEEEGEEGDHLMSEETGSDYRDQPHLDTMGADTEGTEHLGRGSVTITHLPQLPHHFRRYMYVIHLYDTAYIISLKNVF